MNHDVRLQALSAFLKNQRSKISPESVGLPAGTRRRTPGLRREEVSQLAGVSTTWYTWLEQGRDIQVSHSVLDNIASALKLTADERKYLFSLALEYHSELYILDEKPLQIHPSLQKILQELRNCPTIISDRRCHIVGWNDAARHVFMDFEQIPAEQRNMISLLFERKEFRRLAVNWEDFVSGFLAIFRAYYGQYVDDEWYNLFLDDMMDRYPDFHTLWKQSSVSSAPDVLIEFRHSRAGKMLFDLTSLQVQGNADLRCSIYTPATDTATERKLIRLMEPKAEGDSDKS
ncbi:MULTISPECIES: helix-turn-helix transcriptional regulator [unclassified Paenibacillus]|uniref:helix-turn-helix transcriptional regulator n=1 Tax=unclassified Paenibacillus TaxID=185978 RepID=UPI0003FB2A4B|nr:MULTISPECIES: helix-turn-helix transcriptional regulator [unclassified Paenibacillus]KGP79861.1 DNA-binding protein [Paenibacillus sp. MAEPY1]KGP84663.1 DNA-binding protein [Paenibacillus sp. MAEPY2]